MRVTLFSVENKAAPRFPSSSVSFLKGEAVSSDSISHGLLGMKYLGHRTVRLTPVLYLLCLFP